MREIFNSQRKIILKVLVLIKLIIHIEFLNFCCNGYQLRKIVYKKERERERKNKSERARERDKERKKEREREGKKEGEKEKL